MRPVKVFLGGGDGIGWALDDDLAATRSSLQGLADLVELAPLAESEVVHCVWAEGLAAIDPAQLAGKRIVCHLENDLSALLGRAVMLRAASTVGLWVAQNQATRDYCAQVGLPAAFVPYAVDTGVFQPAADAAGARAAFRREQGIPDNRLLIGNFMRDTLGADLTRPKEQKGADVFVALMSYLHRHGAPVHALLAGPRRHWVRARLAECGVPYSYVGRLLEGDDNDVNILGKAQLCRLYQVIDVYAVTSRWEGGPRPLLEALASGCPVVSTRVGLAPDLLPPACLFDGFDEGARLLRGDEALPALRSMAAAARERLLRVHTPDATREHFRAIYRDVRALPIVAGRAAKASVRVPGLAGRLLRAGAAIVPGLRRPETRLRISLWHQFQKPPYGGGNQFMLALKGALETHGARVSTNRLSPDVDVHLCNSTWFDVPRFVRYAERRPLRLLHRIDGPISLYRGTDRALDDEVFALNARLASATVLQSAWSYRQLCAMDYRPVRPMLIHNAVDGRIFHARGRAPFSRGRKVRLVASSWSNNPRKGGPLYKWLEEHLDWDRYEFTFVGRPSVEFERARHLPAMGSEELAAVLRQQDVYVTASQTDPCSNALIEAQACGLPALYFNDGGHPELVAHGGLPFRDGGQLLAQLDRLAENYEQFASLVSVEDIGSVARRYLDAALWVKENVPDDARIAG